MNGIILISLTCVIVGVVDALIGPQSDKAMKLTEAEDDFRKENGGLNKALKVAPRSSQDSINSDVARQSHQSKPCEFERVEYYTETGHCVPLLGSNNWTCQAGQYALQFHPDCSTSDQRTP